MKTVCHLHYNAKVFSLKTFGVWVILLLSTRRAWFVGGHECGVFAQWQCGGVGRCKVKARTGYGCFFASSFGGSSFASCKACKTQGCLWWQMVAFYFVEILVRPGYYKPIVVGLGANNGGDAGLYRQYRGKLPVGHRKRLLSKLYNKWWVVRVLIRLWQVQSILLQVCSLC